MLLKKPKRKRGYKKERILRVLLSNKGDITKYRVAKEAEVSEPWCRDYTSRLEKKGLLDDTLVLSYEEMYAEWEDVHIGSSAIEVSLQNTLKMLKKSSLTYALTTYKAENLHQGFLFPSLIDFYITESERENWLDIIEKKGLIGGGDTKIRLTDDHVFYGKENADGFITVSIPQLILDLRIEGGPCKEAADKLIGRHHGDD
ncbi:MAG: hypothetical protein ACOC1V_07675 [Candidatus Saliniplasma sp.]